MAARKLASVADDAAALAGFSRVAVSMVLTDPRTEDNPIVYVNNAFERTTGYERSAVIGRNCRFLQGEETGKETVDRIRDAVEAERDVAVDILNYRADGEPFYNRLIIAPINDSDGRVIYFLGIQKELRGSERNREEVANLLSQIRERVAEDLAMVLETLGTPTLHDGTLEFHSLNRRLEGLQFVYEGMELTNAQGGADASGGGGVEIGSIVSRIAGSIAYEEGRSGLRYKQDVEGSQVNLDSGVRLAILVSEVLSNAFEHAFERMDEGFVELRMNRLAAGGLRIIVTDDGVGLPKDRPFPDPETMGGRLMNAMVDGLDATMTAVRGAAGTVVIIDVPMGVTEL